jgi:hypothetical protein
MAEARSLADEHFCKSGTKMYRIPVDSSNVAAIGYDPATATLEVEFKDGSVYEYFDVSEIIYESFLASDSKGRFLHQQIRDKYRYHKK